MRNTLFLLSLLMLAGTQNAGLAGVAATQVDNSKIASGACCPIPPPPPPCPDC